MSYRTEINDRRRRRQARVFTALITICLLASFAYAAGLLDQVPELFREAPAREIVVAPVAKA